MRQEFLKEAIKKGDDALIELCVSTDSYIPYRAVNYLGDKNPKGITKKIYNSWKRKIELNLEDPKVSDTMLLSEDGSDMLDSLDWFLTWEMFGSEIRERHLDPTEADLLGMTFFLAKYEIRELLEDPISQYELDFSCEYLSQLSRSKTLRSYAQYEIQDSLKEIGQVIDQSNSCSWDGTVTPYTKALYAHSLSRADIPNTDLIWCARNLLGMMSAMKYWVVPPEVSCDSVVYTAKALEAVTRSEITNKSQFTTVDWLLQQQGSDGLWEPTQGWHGCYDGYTVAILEALNTVMTH